jgi:hypothetical protein
VQVPADASDDPQVFVSLKSPLTLMLVMEIAEASWFVTVTVLAGLVVPIARLSNRRFLADTLTGVPVPVPESAPV